MTNGVYYDFSTVGSIYQDIGGTTLVDAPWQAVGYAADMKGSGTLYHAIAPSLSAVRQWCGWGYLYPAWEDTSLQVTLPDLGSDCSIIIITPSGVSIQEGQTIGAGVYTLPPYPMRVFCIIDRVLNAQEKSDIAAAYGTRYYVNYDETINARTPTHTYHTDADLGWTAGTDVGASGEIQDMIDLLVNGDEVIFDDMYKISGAQYDLTALSNITFRAATKQKCGLNCLDGIQELADNNSLPVNKHAVFQVGDSFLVDGLYCTQDKINPLDTGMAGGGGKRGWFASYNNSTFYGLNCKFDTMGWMHYELGNTDGSVGTAVIARNIFLDGQYCNFITGAVDDMIFAHNYFSGGYSAPRLGGSCCNIFYDGIKTAPISPHRGPRRTVYVENFAYAIVRDCIDTTGGFKDAIVDANVLQRIGTTRIDLKSLYSDSDAVAAGVVENDGVSMQYNLIDMISSNAFVTTTVWDAPDTPDPDYAAGPISSFRNIYRDPRPGRKVVLNKDAKGIVSDQDTFIGEQLYFEVTQDHYKPSLLSASRRSNPILAL